MLIIIIIIINAFQLLGFIACGLSKVCFNSALNRYLMKLFQTALSGVIMIV